MERRRVLRQVAAVGGLAASGGLGALLSACGSDGGDGARAGPTADDGPGIAGEGRGPATTDPDAPWWLRGNFRPVDEEVDAVDLEVRGSLPPELSGLFVRNGSNAPAHDSAHWFFGDGMLHGVRLERGRARWYRNRWVRTPLHEEGVDLLSAGAPGGERNQSNVSVVSHARHLFTLGEIGLPFSIDPATLDTLGAADFDGALATALTAHPKIDPATGRMYAFGYGFVPPYLTYHEFDAHGVLEHSTEVPVGASTMMHDFAVTDREAVFWELPVVFDLEVAVDGGEMPFQWDPAYGARIGILPFGATGADIRWVEIDPCYVFHGINAHRDGDDVVIDVCRMPSMFEHDEPPPDDPRALHRWRVGAGGDGALTFSDERLLESDADLPTIDRRFTGRRYRHAWLADFERGEEPGSVDFRGLVHWDSRRGVRSVWHPAPARRPGEAVLAAVGDGEGEGWLLTYLYDRAEDRSSLAVLDPMDVAAGPVAEVLLPARVPHGFHGWWVPDDPLPGEPV